MAMSVKEQVFRLQISINDLLRMEVLQSQGNFGRIELRYWIGKSLFRKSELDYEGK